MTKDNIKLPWLQLCNTENKYSDFKKEFITYQ